MRPDATTGDDVLAGGGDVPLPLTSKHSFLELVA
jgi:hypothetical protein